MGAAHQLFAPDGKSSQEINGLLPPLPIHPLPGVAASADIPMHLLQEMKYLHDGGYHLVLVGRRADNAEHCIQVRWPPDVYEQASIHIICPSNYPIEAPQLIVTIDELNEYGEVVEYRLDIQSPLINQWNHTCTIIQVVDSVLDILPGAMIDRSHPSSVKIMDQYSEFSGL
jgi:ubiquitin-protein ligase